MNEQLRKAFADELLAAETLTPSYREKYEREIAEMIEKKLTARSRVWLWLCMCAGLAFSGVFGYAILATTQPNVMATVGLSTCVVFGLAWAVVMAWTLKRGSVDMRVHPMATAGLSWAFVVIVMTMLIVESGENRSIESVGAVVNGLAFLVMAAMFLISARIHQSELRTREKLLEIELKLGEVAERLKGKEDEAE